MVRHDIIFIVKLKCTLFYLNIYVKIKSYLNIFLHFVNIVLDVSFTYNVSGQFLLMTGASPFDKIYTDDSKNIKVYRMRILGQDI